MAKCKDLTGIKFGRWTVMGRAENHVSPSGQSIPMWICKCDCGNTGVVAGYALRGGRSRSCGCYCNEESSKRLYKHGGKGTRLFTIWADMKQRCLNENSKGYENYGGRGIRVCEEWKRDFTAFKEWALLNGYSDDLTLDRINTDGNYCPENCRWANMMEQQNNKRNNFMISIGGRSMTACQWAREFGIKPGTIKERIRRGWEPAKAVSEPVRKS